MYDVMHRLNPGKGGDIRTCVSLCGLHNVCDLATVLELFRHLSGGTEEHHEARESG
jgi:hypothetical protein